MKPLLLILIVTFAASLAAQGLLYVPVPGSQQIVQLQLKSGINLLTDVTKPPINLVSVVDVLYAEPDTALGQRAVDDCLRTGNPPPIVGPSGMGQPDCENQRIPAINMDIATRVKAVMASLSDSVLAANKLRRAQ